jgi:hypothetical protein
MTTFRGGIVHDYARIVIEYRIIVASGSDSHSNEAGAGRLGTDFTINKF